MDERKGKCLLLFQSIHKVMQAEHIIAGFGVQYQIIPVPKEYSSECGMCIEIDCSDSNNLLAELQLNRLTFNIVIIKVDS